MKIQLIRHATLVIQVGDRTLLIDPMLGDVGEFESFLDLDNTQVNPTVSLPDDLDLSSMLASVHATFVTHTHRDHFDLDLFEQRLAQEVQGNNLLKALDYLKALPTFCQPASEGQQQSDADWLCGLGFSSVQPVEHNLRYDGIEVFRTDGKHGPNNELGPVSGFVLRSQNEPTLYITGDTIWYSELNDILETYHPEIIVVNAGAAQMYGKPPAITMTKEDVATVCNQMSSATVIAVHMEAIDHCLEHRKDLEAFIESKGLSAHVRIPADGEEIQLYSGVHNY